MGGRRLRQGLVGALVWLACGQAVQAARAPQASRSDREDLPMMSVITQPDWARRPTGEEMAPLYPPLAQLLRLKGEARLQCLVNADGSLYACKVESESPVGLGFGEATLLTASFFRMTPMIIDGKPRVGASVVIPVRWNTDDGQDAASTGPVDDGPADASPEALALGRRIVLASDFKKKVLDAIAAYDRSLIDHAVSNGATAPSPATLERVTGLLRVAYADRVDFLLEREARAYARTLTSAQLMEIARFFESPAGWAFTAQQEKSGMQLQSMDLGTQVLLPAKAAARDIFCRQTLCK